MDKQDIAVIGASAGGLEALQTLFALLPWNLQATLLVVLHTGASSYNMLDHIFAKAGPLPVTYARTGERIRRAHVYVAPTDHHLRVGPAGILHVSHEAKEQRFRPCIDVLFRSAALAFGPRVAGVILTG